MSSIIPKVLILIGEVGSSDSAWNLLVNRIDSESSMHFIGPKLIFNYSKQYDFAYSNPISFIQDTGEMLENFIARTKLEYDQSDFILVGHGIGGLLIKKYIEQQIEKHSLNEISYIRQLIFFSVPNDEVKKSWFKSSILSSREDSRLLKLYEQLGSEIFRMKKNLKEHIILAEEFSSQEKPIPISCFGSAEDQIISESLSRVDATTYNTLEGDHFSIIQPSEDPSDIRFLAFKSLVINPPSHQSIFDIELLNVDIKVSPVAEDYYPVKHGDVERKVKTDNKGIIARRIRFSKENICGEIFTLRYAIENEYGFVKGRTSGSVNKTKESNVRKYKKMGLEYFFEFKPIENLDMDYALEVDILGGFGEKSRDAHFHLGKGRNRYGEIIIELDLTDYKTTYSSINAKLYFHPEDTHSCEQRIYERHPSRIIPFTDRNPEGKWFWNIIDVSGGVVDVVWELNK